MKNRHSQNFIHQIHPIGQRTLQFPFGTSHITVALYGSALSVGAVIYDTPKAVVTTWNREFVYLIPR